MPSKDVPFGKPFHLQFMQILQLEKINLNCSIFNLAIWLICAHLDRWWLSS